MRTADHMSKKIAPIVNTEVLSKVSGTGLWTSHVSLHLVLRVTDEVGPTIAATCHHRTSSKWPCAVSNKILSWLSETTDPNHQSGSLRKCRGDPAGELS